MSVKKKKGLRAFRIGYSDMEITGICFALNADKAKYSAFLNICNEQFCSVMPDGTYGPWRYGSFADLRACRAPEFDCAVPFIPPDELHKGATATWTTDYVEQLIEQGKMLKQ
jgi:hypothetical protein